MNLGSFRKGVPRPFTGKRRLLYGPQLVYLGLGLCFERSGGQNPDTAVAEFDSGRTTTERDDPEPTEWPATVEPGQRNRLKAHQPSFRHGKQVSLSMRSGVTYLEKIQTSFATSRMTVSLMVVVS